MVNGIMTTKLDKNGVIALEYIGRHEGMASVIRVKGVYYIPTGQGVFHEYWTFKEFPKDKRTVSYKPNRVEYTELTRQYDKQK